MNGVIVLPEGKDSLLKAAMDRKLIVTVEEHALCIFRPS